MEEGIAGSCEPYEQLHLKRMVNKDLLYSLGPSVQCQMAARMGGEFGEDGHMYTFG